MRQRGADHSLVRCQQYRNCLCPGFIIGLILNGNAYGDPGIVDDYIQSAKMCCDRIDAALDLISARDVELPGLCTLTSGDDFSCHGFCGVGVGIGDCDVGALCGEHPCGRAAHAAARASNESRQSPDRAAELVEIRHAVLLSDLPVM